MAMSFKLVLAVAAASLALGGCDTVDPVSHSVDPGFGEALAYDKAIQTINPDPLPPPPGAAQPGDSGQKGVGAVDRYRKGTVKEPEKQSTTGSGGSR
jgi:hypothetical protein